MKVKNLILFPYHQHCEEHREGFFIILTYAKLIIKKDRSNPAFRFLVPLLPIVLLCLQYRQCLFDLTLGPFPR